MKKGVLWLTVVLFSFVTSESQDGLCDWAALTAENYRITDNVVYKRANNFECKLDVIAARDKSRPRPTLVYIHGGGWRGGSKETSVLRLLPYLARGMNVVNVGYRLSPVSLAPAAVDEEQALKIQKTIFSFLEERGILSRE